MSAGGGRLTRMFLEAALRQLPPSSADLRLLDVDGRFGATLSETRADLVPLHAPPQPGEWAVEPDSVDAVAALDADLTPGFLGAALAALRPGGRLIVIQRSASPDESAVRALEAAGYVRILVEAAVECPLPTGALVRGEKPHTTTDTLQRIRQVAGQDADALSLADFRGRYLHLLVIQTPNKPVWAIRPDEPIQWQAATAGGALLAFSSLPKAVAFMQEAVLSGALTGINKVGKFSRATAESWTTPVLLNPALGDAVGRGLGWHSIDPASAEAPDE